MTRGVISAISQARNQDFAKGRALNQKSKLIYSKNVSTGRHGKPTYMHL